MKKLLSLSLIVLSALLVFCSCGITDLFEKTNTATVSTTSVAKAVTTADDTPIAEPTTESMNFEGADLSEYITLDYKGLEFTSSYEIRTITDEIIDSEMDEMLLYYGFYTLNSSGITTSGATIEIDYIGYMDGEALSNAANENQTILLDEDESGYIPGFASGLVGKEVGSTVELNLTFPDNYYSGLSGKAVTFSVKINGICEAEKTDEVASSATGGQYTTMAAFRAYYKDYLEEMDVYLQFSEVSEQIFDKLDEICIVNSYPEQQVQYYYEQMVYEINYYAKQNSTTYESLMQTMGYTEETLREDAKSYVKSDLILYYIANEEGVYVTDEIYTDYLNEIVENYNSQGYSYSATVIENYYDSYYGEGYLRSQCQQEKVADAVYKYAKVTYDPNFVLETDDE